MKFSTGARKKENTLRIGSRVCSGALPGGIAPATFPHVFVCTFPRLVFINFSQSRAPLVYKGEIRSFSKRLDVYR